MMGRSATIVALTLGISVLGACGGAGGGGEGVAGEEDAPVAAFTADPRSGTTPLSVGFADQSTGTVGAWSWDFGDGALASEQHPVHTYTAAGSYDVALTVTGPGGSSTHREPGLVTVNGSDGITCEAEDAADNTALPLKVGVYDFVPSVADLSEGLFVVYSVKNMEDGSPGVGNNVGIFLLDLGGNEVLMFGSGYGDVFLGVQGPLFSAAFDMAMVDEVIQGCMGKTPASTVIRFVAPHGHVDHVNADSLRELRTLGYAIGDIYFHEADAQAIAGFPRWTQQDLDLFRPLSGAACVDELLAFDSPLGRIWFLSRPGHTDGSIDLVLDVNGEVNDRILILGSEPGGPCGGNPAGTRLTIKAHGNVLLP